MGQHPLQRRRLLPLPSLRAAGVEQVGRWLQSWGGPQGERAGERDGVSGGRCGEMGAAVPGGIYWGDGACAGGEVVCLFDG